MSLDMPNRLTHIHNCTNVASKSAKPTAAEFAEYTTTILEELSKAARGYGLPVLALLISVAESEARLRVDGRENF